MTKKKMGGLGKLSQFSGIKSQDEIIPPVQEDSSLIQNSISPIPRNNGSQPKIQNGEKLVTINIKIPKAQKDWLADTASQVRDNNSEPVPPSERVYPQHLIGVAIELLQSSDVDWSQVKNEKELREHLNL